MALTPYPNEQYAYENPSILVSNNGSDWSVPPGLTNPIEPFANNVYNSDPEIIVDPYNTMWLFWRLDDTKNDYIYARSSADGINWTSKVQVLKANYTTALSPALYFDGSQYIMWTVSTDQTITRRTASSLTGPWSTPTNIILKFSGASFIPWHLNVTARNGVLWMILSQNDGINLWLATSADNGLNWTTGSNPLLRATSNSWDSYLYRSTLVVTSTGFDLWYSAFAMWYTPTYGTTWHIGRTPVTVGP